MDKSASKWNEEEFDISMEELEELTSFVPSSSTTNQQNNASVKSAKAKRHEVWKYFQASEDNKNSKCLIEGCAYSSSGAFTTNLMNHLKSAHPEVHKTVTNAKAEKKTKVEVGKERLQKVFTEQLALWISRNCTIPINSVTQDDFNKLIAIANPSLTVPSVPTLNKVMDEQKLTLKNQIKEMLMEPGRIALSADIWSKKNHTSSYLGVLATFFLKSTKSKIVVLLDVKQIESLSHTSADIIREMKVVIKDYNIPSHKIWFTVTDSASNMICAFRDSSFMVKQDDLDEDDLDIVNTDIYEENAELDSDVSHTPYQRYSCFVHSLLLCLQPFDICSSFVDVIAKCKKIVRKFNKSQAMTGMLIEKSKVKLLSFSKARWNIIYLFISRIIKVKEHLNTILNLNGHHDLLFTEMEWNQLMTIKSFLEPFHTFTDMTSKETTTFFSEATTALKQMEHHLSSYKNSECLSVTANSILEEIRKRFYSYSTNLSDDSLTVKICRKTLKLYLASTLVDPRFRHCLDHEEEVIGKNLILELEGNFVKQKCPDSSNIQPPLKRTKYTFMSMYEQPTTEESLLEVEINNYMSCKNYNMGSQTNPLNYWLERESTYPLLSVIALDLLCLPLNTAPLERSFSYGGIATLGLRNRLSGEHLGREIFMSRNKVLK